MRPLLAAFLVAEPLTPQRWWLERLAFVVPGPAASRWLLLADTVCLVVLGARTRRPRLGVPVAVVLGFVLLNGLDLALNDFYLALAAFHVAVGAATLVIADRSRWLGGALLTLAVVLGILT